MCPKTLTPRMKHTRVPRTVRRDIWRLAIETSSIPSLHIFEAESGIRSQVESKAGKARNGPNRKLNCLTKKKKSTYLVPLLLGLIDVAQGLHQLRTFLLRITVTRKFNLPYAISDQTSLLCTNFVPTLISPTLYGLLYSLVMFLQQRTKDFRTNNPQRIQQAKAYICIQSMMLMLLLLFQMT